MRAKTGNVRTRRGKRRGRRTRVRVRVRARVSRTFRHGFLHLWEQLVCGLPVSLLS
jgi:hypothetical protein